MGYFHLFIHIVLLLSMSFTFCLSLGNICYQFVISMCGAYSQIIGLSWSRLVYKFQKRLCTKTAVFVRLSRRDRSTVRLYGTYVRGASIYRNYRDVSAIPILLSHAVLRYCSAHATAALPEFRKKKTWELLSDRTSNRPVSATNRQQQREKS